MDIDIGKNLVDVAIKQIDASSKHKQARMEDIKKYEDSYNNVTEIALRGRYNVPLPVMGGFVDTLMSKIDDPPKIVFEADDEADDRKARKKTALLKKDASSARGKWASKDRDMKKLAIFSGRGIGKYYASSEGGEYQSNLDVIDYYDFHCEPNGGGELEDHLFCGQENVFKTKTQLEDGAKDGTYNKKQVAKLIYANDENDLKEIDQLHKNKINRFEALNLGTTENYVGENLYNLMEWCLNYKGKRYYLLFDFKSQVWVRAEELKEVFKSNLYPHFTWATHPDRFNFWSKAPADDVFPIADAMKTVVNQTLYNINKRNAGQRAYDIDMFPDPATLEFRPDGLTPVNPKGQNIGNGIYEFETPDTTNISIRLVDFFDNFLGKKTGITPDAQGMSEEKRVGIYYGNMQQVADRLGLINKSYTESYTDLGIRHSFGADENLKREEAIKLIGVKKGIEWDKIKQEDLRTTKPLRISVVSASAEVQANEEKTKNRTEALTSLMANPNTGQKLNPNWVIEQVLKNSGYEDDEIKEATDVQHFVDRDLMSEAAQATEDIIAGKEVKTNRGANPAFIQKILDFATDNDIDDKKFRALTDYANLHTEIAIENTARKIAKDKGQQGMEGLKPTPQMPQQAPLNANQPIE